MDFDSIIKGSMPLPPAKLKKRYNMAKWNENPTYTALSEINGGNQYAKCDGMKISDINKLFENVKYLKGEKA